MLRKQNKKGFTLAELLIVVAIIAVLTAIAVPLFVGALNNAEKKVEAANKRAVRGAAVEAILLDEKYQKTTQEDGTVKVYDKWTAEAIISANGEVKALKITCDATVAEASETCRKATTSDKIGELTATTSDYYVKIGITELKAS